MRPDGVRQARYSVPAPIRTRMLVRAIFCPVAPTEQSVIGFLIVQWVRNRVHPRFQIYAMPSFYV